MQMNASIAEKSLSARGYRALSSALLAAWLLLNWTPVSNADAPPEGLHELIANIAANERLFETLEVRYRRDFEYLGPKDHGLYEGGLILKSHEAERSVQQGPLKRRSADYDVSTFQGREQSTGLTSYDGDCTWVVESGSPANIHDGPNPKGFNMFRPHMLLLAEHGGFRMPFSEFLAAKEFGFWKRMDRYLEGEATVDGLRCVQLRVDGYLEEDKIPGVLLRFWICPERNYLPIRAEGYCLSDSKDMPIVRMAVAGLREIEPGVWMPLEMTCETLYEVPLRKGEQVLLNRTVLTIDKVDLHPAYDKSFFSDVSIPAGTTVHRLKDGKIYETYKQPGDKQPQSMLPPTWNLWLWGGLAVAATTAVWLWRRKLHISAAAPA